MSKYVIQNTCISFLLYVFFSTTVIAADINASIITGVFVPLKPTSLGVSVDDGSVYLSWSVPFSDGGSSITDYIVEYKQSTSGLWLVYPEGVSTVTFATLTTVVNDISYDFRVSATNSMGQGPYSTTVSATPGVPGSISITNIEDVLLPDITAQVTITNLGSTAYEYQYSWCVTNSALNLCGGGNDISGSSATIFLQPGESWSGSLVTTHVETAGKYWFHTQVRYGSDVAYDAELFTAVSDSDIENPSISYGSSAHTNTTSCIGADINKDGKVDTIDYVIVVNLFNSSAPFANICADINKDTYINGSDFSILLTQWGKKPMVYKY